MRTTDEIESHLQHCIRKSTSKNIKLIPKGVCYYCDSDIKYPKLFCSNECADDYEKEQKLRKQNN